MSHDSGLNTGQDIDDAVESTLDDATGRLREKGTKLGRKAVSAIDESRGAVAERLEVAARGLRNKGEAIADGAERVSRVTHDVADRVDDASRYIRNNDAKDMLADVRSMVRAHPTRSLIAVLAVGFLAGRAFRRE